MPRSKRPRSTFVQPLKLIRTFGITKTDELLPHDVVPADFYSSNPPTLSSIRWREFVVGARHSNEMKGKK